MYLEEALTRFQDQYPIVLRNRNADIQSQNPHSHQFAYLLMEFGMMDLIIHFRKHWRYRHMTTWPRVKQGKVMRARSDYIPGIDGRRFEMMGIRGTRNYPSDHLILQSWILCPTEPVQHCNVGGHPHKWELCTEAVMIT